MASNSQPRKNAFRAALDSFAKPDNREDILKIVHAILSTAMVNAAVEKTDDAKKAAKTECFAECIQLCESEMGDATSPFIPKKQTILTTPGHMPSVIRASQSRQTPQT